ncbi:BREX-3 system phosphatase PglZ [Desulfovibrio sp. OttesenSCG-928-G11]|nr:BREX-3 system phosphatase PglZ [Desulfovibrio sp. OttesenSCG-928-G11]
MDSASSWRDAILQQFIPIGATLNLVADPDALFSEEGLVLALRDAGYTLLEFRDPVEFRYAYESTCHAFNSPHKPADQADERGGLIVVVNAPDTEFSSVPYDVFQEGRRLSVSLGELFPNLSYPVVAELERSHLDKLFTCHTQYAHERMGDNASRDFILRHVFGIAAELLRNNIDLLRTLLRLHYPGIQLPPGLARRLIQILKSQPLFAAWALEEIVPDDKAFFAFLQERWPAFLNRVDETTANQLRETPAIYGLRYAGPVDLPFEHEDIRVYIDNLFVEGKLFPVSRPDMRIAVESWIRCGILENAQSDATVRLTRLLAALPESLPGLDAKHTDWIAFAPKWAELTALAHNLTMDQAGQKDFAQFKALSVTVQEAFFQWLTERDAAHYAGLVNQPPGRPVMLHHIARFLARELGKDKETRIALLVVDGLALDQWVTVRQELQGQIPKLVMRETSVFTWIPTLTSVSRQALFAGKAPFYFPSSIKNTNAEENLWRQFWEDAGVPKNAIAYKRGLGSGDAVTSLENAAHPERTKILGLVVDTVDSIMHGMQLGAAGMHNQVRQWCAMGFLRDCTTYLLGNGYQVWLTSDHGNIECRGKGRPADGILAESRGERARVYPTPELRSQIAGGLPDTFQWPPVGLPDGYYPLLAKGQDAFCQENSTIVGHGSISLEEVLVPFVKIERSV